VLGTLGGLVEQSMILAEYGEEGDGIRYRMLEPIRQYAREKLQERREAEQARRLHARYYLDPAEQAEPRMKGHSQVEWLDKLEAENDKLRAAIGGSLKARDAQTAARFGWADGEEGFGLAPRIILPARGHHLEEAISPIPEHDDGDGVIAHAVHAEFSRGPVGRARVVREVGLRDLDSRFG
jgi:hypothetical protein